MQKLIALAISAQIGLITVGAAGQAHAAKNTEAYGYIDRTGKLTIAASFDEASEFSEGLAAVKIGEKYGYVDKTGQMKIAPTFDTAKPFRNGLAAVISNANDVRLYGYIDTTGTVVIPAAFESANPFSEGVAAVKFPCSKENGITSDTQWGYIDKTGKTVIKPAFAQAEDFQKGFAVVYSGQKAGAIDRDGTFAVKPAYQMLLANSDNTFSVLKTSGPAMSLVGFGYNWLVSGGLFGFVDSKGKTLIKPTYDGASSFSEGLACVTTGEGAKGGQPRNWLYIDESGTKKIDGKFSFGLPFAEGLAPVAKGRWQNSGMTPALVSAKWGFIDKKGKTVVPLNFDEAHPFSCGMARVVADGKCGFVNHDGKIAIEPKFSDADDFSEDLAVVKTTRTAATKTE